MRCGMGGLAIQRRHGGRGGRQRTLVQKTAGGGETTSVAPSLKHELLGLLPRVLGVAEVAVRSSLKVLGLLEAERLDCKRGGCIQLTSSDSLNTSEDVPMTPGRRSKFLRMT